MGQILKYISKNGKSFEFSNKGTNILQKVSGLSGVDATEVSYKGILQDGESYNESNLEKRQIVIKFALKCSSINDLLSTRALINSVFNPKQGEGTLIYTYNGISRSITCVPDGTPKMPLEGNKTDCTGEIVLLAHNPYFTDIKENKKEIALWESKFHFPLIIPKTKGIIMGLKQPSLIVNIINTGDVECGIKIEFKAKGMLKNPSLFNVNTREYIKILKEMTAGEVILVNTNYGQKRIESTLNGITTNILNLIDLGGGDTFLQLGIGDNLFRYNADINPSNLEINIYYSPKYLGV